MVNFKPVGDWSDEPLVHKSMDSFPFTPLGADLPVTIPVKSTAGTHPEQAPSLLVNHQAAEYPLTQRCMRSYHRVILSGE
jgi:hypothetical protein